MLQRIAEPKVSRKVVVVGGGPAGMTAAITAAERGHQVTLLEKSFALGGLLKTMDLEPAKWEVKRYKDFLVSRTHKTVNDVRLNTEATPELLEALNADVVIAAVGARFLIPSLPGVDKDNALTALDVYYHPEKIGQNVVMIGGGTTACEAALFLAKQGKKVTIVEMREELGNRLDNGFYQWPLVDTIESEPNVSFKLQTKCMGVDPKGVRVEKDGKQEVIPADTVVFSVGQIPEAETVGKLRNSGRRFCTVGDCVDVKNITQATRTAFFCAMNIL
jgi:NADPH-dependent 2,4-dienoyl-CoA reductase/sulfur reductase-like enzyme